MPQSLPDAIEFIDRIDGGTNAMPGAEGELAFMRLAVADDDRRYRYADILTLAMLAIEPPDRRDDSALSRRVRA